jgi:hypothetical protein
MLRKQGLQQLQQLHQLQQLQQLLMPYLEQPTTNKSERVGDIARYNR